MRDGCSHADLPVKTLRGEQNDRKMYDVPCPIYRSQADLVGDSGLMHTCDGSWLGVGHAKVPNGEKRTERGHQSNLWKSLERPLLYKELSCVDTRVTGLL